MNKLLLGILTLLAFTASAQQNEVDTLNYCGKDFAVPEGCSANSPYELSCDGFVIQWLYMNNQMLQTMPQQFVNQLDEKLKRMTRKRIECISLGERMNGYKISYRHKRETNYKIIAYGPINGQPVMIILTLQNDPVNNEALPEFAKKIITLKEI